MTDEKKIQEAKATFATLCRTLDKNNWKYQIDEEKLSIFCGAQGDDLPMEITVNVDVDKRLVLLFSRIPFAIQEDKRLDVAVAVSAINNALVDGCFDYNIATGSLFFRMTNSFIECELSEEVFAYMLFCSCQIIDEHNDRFLMLSKGLLSMEQFLSALED